MRDENDEDFQPNPIEHFSITGPCSHVFCTQCITASVRETRQCAMCRREMRVVDILPLSAQLKQQDEKVVKDKDNKEEIDAKIAEVSAGLEKV